MQFLVLAYDGTDEKALERRLAAREEHLKKGAEMAAAGTILYATALQSNEGKMIGSVIVCDFPSRKALDQWLVNEPYIKGDVWQKVEIMRCQQAPFIK